MHQLAVYILKCRDDSFYVGITNNLERRIAEHQQGLNPKSYTFKRKPIKLVFYQYFNDPQEAIAFEKQLKKWRRAKKEALINQNWHLLTELSKSYNKNQK